MDKFEDILKRLVNVITLVAALTIVVSFIQLIEGSGSTWRKFDRIEVCSVILAGVIAVNYIVFKRITLWHKSK